MQIKIGRYVFEGPFPSATSLRNQSGVYAILDCRLQGNFVIDIGESKEVRHRIESHDRKACWSNNCQGVPKVAALYVPQSARMIIEKELRRDYRPPCGEF